MAVVDAIQDLADVVDAAKTFKANYDATYGTIISSQLGSPTEDDYGQLARIAKDPAGTRAKYARLAADLREEALIVLRDVAREINRGDVDAESADPVTILKALRTWMVDNSTVFESLAVTHNAVSALSTPLTSGADGALLMCSTDDQSTADNLEAITADTLRFECVAARGEGRNSGNELFEVWASSGQPAKDIFDWPAFSSRIQLPVVNAGILSHITNGNFEQSFGSGTTDKIPGWTLDSNHANAIADTTNYYRGSQAIRLTGACELTQEYAGLPPNTPVLVSVMYNRSAGTGTGSLDIRIGGSSDTTVSALSGASAGWNRTHFIAWPKRFNKSPFNVQIELDAAGEAISGYTVIDEVIVAPLTRIGGRYFILLAGATDFGSGDYFTQASSVTGTGLIKWWLHQWFGRAFELPHDATATVNWTDPS